LSNALEAVETITSVTVHPNTYPGNIRGSANSMRSGFISRRSLKKCRRI
jgi:hypothetical protein